MDSARSHNPKNTEDFWQSDGKDPQDLNDKTTTGSALILLGREGKTFARARGHLEGTNGEGMKAIGNLLTPKIGGKAKRNCV
jgi:hypothetical protein